MLFCDLVDSTPLARQLDPEELRTVVRAYQEACAKVIARYEGHIAQYLGDGLLVYFGYPQAHEDDAQRAVRAGLGIVEAMGQLNARLGLERGVNLAVRLGIHTGLVVVGDIGGGARQEQLALGETPNLAARLQEMAPPNALVISIATLQLLGGFFACQSLGPRRLKGLAQPLEVYQVRHESTARSRLEAAGRTGWTPLVGREQEVTLLREHWAQVKDGLGQVVLLSGEAGIGKSRLVQMLTEQVAAEPQAWLTPCQCSPYYQHSALYPIIELLERVVLRFDREESPPQKLNKLEGLAVQYGLPLAEAVPLLAALLSLPLTADYVPLHMSPEQQKQQTLHVLLTMLLCIATQQPLLFVMEDLHWVDPSTLEFLNLLVDQGPTAHILALFTFRPDFSPPWTGRSHLTQITVTRLPRRQAEEMITRVAHDKALPPEVVEQVIAKTDGVPLFVEELTKMVLESALLQEREGRYELTGPLLTLAIPATLHDSLMARLDRLATVKAMAQLGATIGRTFTYELLRAVAPWDEESLQRGLHQLVEAEFLYQRGLPPNASYLFKHALIQEAAYQSLLRSTRHQYHQQIAHVLEVQFPETTEIHPEVLAHHYTEAGYLAQAIPYWQRAGERASQRSANLEAIAHLSRGLELLKTLPSASHHAEQELHLQLTLGGPLLATKGHAAPDVEHAYARARELCQQVGETEQIFPALLGLFLFHLARAELQIGRELGEQLLALAQRNHDRSRLVVAHRALGSTLFYLGEVALALEHTHRGAALYDTQPHVPVRLSGQDLGVFCRIYAAMALWLLGYPDQARAGIQSAHTLAQEINHPFCQAVAQTHVAWVHQYRREVQKTHEVAEATIVLTREQGFAFYLAIAVILWGWATALQDQWEEGIAQMRQGLDAYMALGSVLLRPWFLAMLAEAYGVAGQTEAGLEALTEALSCVGTTEERWWEAELHRLKGELQLKHATDHAAEAEVCFHQARTIACRQQAKSLELRATMSLARLWQHQGKGQDAYDLLAPVYDWFTEGFDTADLQEAKRLLGDLS